MDLVIVDRMGAEQIYRDVGSVELKTLNSMPMLLFEKIQDGEVVNYHFNVSNLISYTSMEKVTR